MTTPETKQSQQLEVLRLQAGADAVLAHMLKMNRPLTVETYVRMSWPGKRESDLGAEELASIPEGLTRELPAPPKREDFPNQAEYEEAQGGWRSRVGRIHGMKGVKPTEA